MSPIAAFWANPWGRRACIALGVLLALAAAFSAGRFSAPMQTVTRDAVKTEYVDRVHETVRTVTVQAEAKTETKIETRVIYRDVERKPDGTVIDHSVVKVGAADIVTASSKTETKSDDSKTEQVSASTLQEHTQSVTLRPSWAVTLQVGASLPKPWLPLYGPLVLGAEVDYRIVGGLSAGVWINTFGAAGLALKLEF